MKELRLNRLGLSNFKGLKKFELNIDGSDIIVRGDNATGKTTLADAFSWLLFGKDSQGHADFEIKTLSPAGEAVHGLEHSVETVLSMADKEIELRKVYREKWTKKRGGAEKEFTGHTRDHFFDGVPISQSDYESHIAKIATEDIFRLLTSPVHFAERLHWQERRQILLDICGDISDADVIASTSNLADLQKILDGHSLDDQRKIVQARKRKINEELQRIPVRIDEVSRSLPQAMSGDEKPLRTLLSAMRAERGDIEAERSRIQAGGQIAEKTKRLREVEAAFLDETNSQRALAQEATQNLRKDRDGAQSGLARAVGEIRRLEVEISRATEEIDSLKTWMDERRTRWHQIDAAAFAPEPGLDSCAACGQKLPADVVEETRAKALAFFNEDKARRLEEVAAEGKRFSTRCDELKSDSEKRTETLMQGEATRGKLRELINKISAEIDQVEAEQDIPGQSERHSALTKERLAIESEILHLREGTKDALSGITERLSVVDAKIAEFEGDLSRLAQRNASEQRIEELKREERRLAGEYEELERQLYLCDEFTRRKVSMLTGRINNRFELARFKLFNVLVNGGVEECCEVSFEGVPWASLNSGAQINIGLDAIRTLSRHYEIAPPIFIDHSESITQLLPTPGQQIRLIVSEADKTLRIEEI